MDSTEEQYQLPPSCSAVPAAQLLAEATESEAARTAPIARGKCMAMVVCYTMLKTVLFVQSDLCAIVKAVSLLLWRSEGGNMGYQGIE